MRWRVETKVETWAYCRNPDGGGARWRHPNEVSRAEIGREGWSGAGVAGAKSGAVAERDARLRPVGRSLGVLGRVGGGGMWSEGWVIRDEKKRARAESSDASAKMDMCDREGRERTSSTSWADSDQQDRG
jgi:hypothetical protein